MTSSQARQPAFPRVSPAVPHHGSCVRPALYFALTTITTVGFGDIVPVRSHIFPHTQLFALWSENMPSVSGQVTTGGRLVVLSTILVGLAIVPAQVHSPPLKGC